MLVGNKLLPIPTFIQDKIVSKLPNDKEFFFYINIFVYSNLLKIHHKHNPL